MKKFLKYPVLILFSGIVIFFSLGDLITPDSEFSETENKYLATVPVCSVSALLDSSQSGFAQKYEKYTNEQFLFRDTWISIKSACETVLLKVENNGIVYGSDGYMFDKFTEFDQDRKKKNMDALVSFGNSFKDIKKTLLIAPSAYEVMEDKLPDGLNNIDQTYELLQLRELLCKNGYDYIDLKEPLQKKVDEGEYIYYKTDHHWTTKGAYEAYLSLCRERGLTPVAFDVKRATDSFLGTHYSKCKKLGKALDSIDYYDASISEVTIDGKKKDGIYDYSMLEKRDKYAFFIWGNNGITEIINDNAQKNETLMVIKDSYANSLVPFLTANYKKVVVIDLRSLPQNLSEVIDKFKPSEIVLNYNIKNVLTDTDIPRIKY